MDPLTSSDIRNQLHEYLLRVCDLEPVEFDPEWPSLCHVGEPDEDGMIGWQPVAMETVPDFGPVESVLAAKGLTLHPDVVTLYGSFWAGHAEDEHSGRSMSLGTVWNEEELQRGIEQLAHGARLQLAEPNLPLAFGVASSDSDLMFVLDNATGAIHLQEPFREYEEMVAPSLLQFLKDLC